MYPPADTVLNGGVFFSGDSRQPILAGAEALAIHSGTITAVGPAEAVLSLAGPQTEIIELGGRLVVPGFIDTHLHFYEWSLKRRDLQLEDAGSLEELLARVSQAASEAAAGQWIMGQGWNETDWDLAQMPDRASLDSAAPANPVLLWRCDLHLAVANSCALGLAGIDAHTDDPADGRIERDSSGAPTGVLRELAINLVRQAVAVPPLEEILMAFEDGYRALHRLGITGIHDIRLMNDADGARALQCFSTLEEEERLQLRTWVTLPGHRLDEIIALGLRSGFGSDTLRIGHVKFFSDGGMGARTAWMIDPFIDAGCGMPMLDMERLKADIAKAERSGLSVMVHAVGDRANRELIGVFSEIQAGRERGARCLPKLPHRIEHVQMIRPEDTRKLQGLDLALCVTPCNMILDINLIDKAVGARGKWTYPFRSLIDTGAPVLFSSDCPVCSPAPLPAIHAAVTRQRPDGSPEGGWYPEQRVTAAEALAAFTSTPAAVHRADHIGLIEVGKKADLAILSRNILTEPAATIANTEVDMTLFDGQVVHRAF